MSTKAVFIIAVTTIRMLFPGISPTVNLPGREPPKLAPATKSVTISLFSNREAGPRASARVRVPKGLEVGEMITLEIHKPGSEQRGGEPKTESVIRSKTYWGCAETVPEGQPRCDDPPKAYALGLPAASSASWPGTRDKPLAETAQVQGSYALTTNFTGSAGVTVGSDQEFLAPVELSGVDDIKLGQTINIKWAKVPRALAYLVTAFGGTEKESVTWTSSADPDAAEGLPERALSEAEIKDLIEKNILLCPETVSCTIPAAVFAGARGAAITVTAFGPDKIRSGTAVETRVIVRSFGQVALVRETGTH